MSKLYLTATTDLKMPMHSRAHKWVDATVGYDEEQIFRQVRFKIFREPDGALNAQIYDTNNPTLMVQCKGTDKDGLLSCKVVNPNKVKE